MFKTVNSGLVYIINDGDVEILINKIFQKYGYDFSDYSYTSFKRRVDRVIINYRILSFKNLLNKVLTDQVFFNTFLEESISQIETKSNSAIYFIEIKSIFE